MALVGSTVVEATKRYEVFDPNTISGHLVWNDGQGAIAWDPGAQTEPTMRAGKADCVPPDQSWCQAEGHVEFQSDPFPQTIFLNVNRQIWMDIAFEGENCFHRQVGPTLFVGTTILAGHPMERKRDGVKLDDPDAQVPSDFQNQGYPKYPNVPGRCINYFRLHPEVDRIEKGAIIVLDLQLMFRNPETPQGPSQGSPVLSFSAPARSYVNFTYWPLQEASRRVPELTKNAEQEFLGFGPTSPTPTAGVLIGSLLWRPAGGRRRHAAPVLVVFLLVAFGGCAGGPKQDANAPDQALVKRDAIPYEADDPSQGALIGRVFDEYNYTISGAVVSLPGTDLFTTSDQYGRYVFWNLVPGNYRVRFEFAGYRGFETTETVRGGFATRLDVQLVPLFAKGLRPHDHDYWGPQHSLLIVNYTGPYVLGNYPRLGGAIPLMGPDGRAKIIVPGTYRVEIDVRPVVPTAGRQDYYVLFRSNIDSVNESIMAPRTFGNSTFLATSWEMADEGHQKQSLWTLNWFPLGAHQGTWNVRVTLHRGVLPVERAHPDLWRSKDVFFSADFTPINAQGWACSVSVSGCVEAAKPPVSPPRPIPPQTAWIQVFVEQKRDSRQEVDLVYRPSEDVAWTQIQPVGSRHPYKNEFRIAPVNESDWDGYYQPASFWSFYLVVASQDPADDPVKPHNTVNREMDRLAEQTIGPQVQDAMSAAGVSPGKQAFAYTVIAHRDASMGSMGGG